MSIINKFVPILLLLIIACNGDTPEAPQAPETPPPPKPYENLRSIAIPEEDIMSRIELGLNTLQYEYDQSAPSMPDLGKMTVLVDEACNLTIRNEKNGDVYETKVNMHDLNIEQGGMRLIPDQQPGEFPGLRIKTINDIPVVSILKNGKEITYDNELVIYLANRKSIEKVTPAMVQTIRICQQEN